MAKYGKKIIIGTAVIAVLILAFVFGGGQKQSVTSNDNATSVSQKNENKTDEKNTVKSDDTVKKDQQIPENSTAQNSQNPEQTPTQNTDTAAAADKYNTTPVPDGKPKPVEPQDAEISNNDLKCTLSVRCDTILNNINSLNPEKKELVPKDGIIFKSRQVVFYEGESVFNVLLREMKKNKIHMEFTNTPIYNSAYIEGIANLYEFDCGDLSGWMYKVNGWFPNYGCSRYKLKDGDVIEWVYTCDLGKDVGEDFSSYGGQKDE
mgnify:CR=1 FL=1